MLDLNAEMRKMLDYHRPSPTKPEMEMEGMEIQQAAKFLRRSYHRRLD